MNNITLWAEGGIRTPEAHRAAVLQTASIATLTPPHIRVQRARLALA